MAQEPRAQSFAISNFFLAHTGWNEWPGDFTRDKESQAESLSFTISTRWHEWPGVLEPPYASSATGSFAANTAFSNSIDSEESAGFPVDSREALVRIRFGRIRLDLPGHHSSICGGHQSE